MKPRMNYYQAAPDTIKALVAGGARGVELLVVGWLVERSDNSGVHSGSSVLVRETN